MSGEPAIRVIKGGPYQISGAVELNDHLGRPIAHEESARLCRCGHSATKPFCDDACVASGFVDDKDSRRVPDKLDVYVGEEVTVYDNRGLCAHSGFCTDRVPGVFHLGEEPFVTPSGARADDILRAARRCPSGAIGIGTRAGKDHAWSDVSRPAAIEVSKDGPYRITGGVRLIDEQGASITQPEGASQEHYSLCRCGSSLNKPFCSGMHWTVEFKDPPDDPEAEPTLYEWAGGYPALLDMTRIFYGRHVPADPLIGPLFANMSPDHPERVAAWLSEVFGGPKFYSERYGGYERMLSQHVGRQIRPEQRARWAQLMAQSADQAGLPADAEFRAAFMAYIEWGSRLAVENSQAESHPPPHMPVPRWWWVCEATPGARVSALAPPEEAEAQKYHPPVEGEVPKFDAHIRPLFRPRDRSSMRFAFDLWSEEDVRTHAEAILARLKAGTMPCDGAWPADRVAIFERWAAAQQS
jgi:truncated hemoglobin YjbI/CDGSH-type Zn-finger protein/ferredoxin